MRLQSILVAELQMSILAWISFVFSCRCIISIISHVLILLRDPKGFVTCLMGLLGPESVFKAIFLYNKIEKVFRVPKLNLILYVHMSRCE